MFGMFETIFLNQLDLPGDSTMHLEANSAKVRYGIIPEKIFERNSDDDHYWWRGTEQTEKVYNAGEGLLMIFPDNRSWLE